tara:strand:- start:307 stop:942 length:636 start_codon:yes stop_codon:yes gene_type:complete
MKRFLLLTAAVFAFGAFTTSSFAEDAKVLPAEHYNFDKAHTQILFFVDHLGFSTSQGEFLGYDGSFDFDNEHPEKSSVDITIQSASIDMDDTPWDDHMKSKDFFNVEEFPTMTFKSTEIKVTGRETADITGDFTLLGITKPVTLKVKHNKSGKHAFSGKYVSGFSATTQLKRSDFGMVYGLPMIGDDIDIRIEVEGIRDDQADEAKEEVKE